jgi:5-methylcytosine-specific restriction endonuclease McrA
MTDYKPNEHNYINEPCTATGYTIVKKQTATVIVIRSQCECGYVGARSYKQGEFDLSKLPFLDLQKEEKRISLIDDFHKKRCEKIEQKNQQRLEDVIDFWQEYKEYLNSDKWKTKRERVLDRDNYLCQACLSAKATQVHHLTYSHVFNEPMFDLVSICKRCHDKITEMDRERRI